MRSFEWVVALDGARRRGWAVHTVVSVDSYDERKIVGVVEAICRFHSSCGGVAGASQSLGMKTGKAGACFHARASSLPAGGNNHENKISLK